MPTNGTRTATRVQTRAAAMSRSKSPPPPVARKVIVSSTDLSPEGTPNAFLFIILNYVPLFQPPIKSRHRRSKSSDCWIEHKPPTHLETGILTGHAIKLFYEFCSCSLRLNKWFSSGYCCKDLLLVTDVSST